MDLELRFSSIKNILKDDMIKRILDIILSINCNSASSALILINKEEKDESLILLEIYL